MVTGGLVLALGACSGAKQPQAPAPGTAASSTGAAVGWEQDNPDEVTPPRSAAQLSADMLDKVLADSGRGKDAAKLDALRHPRQTLAFFGLQPDMTVVQIEPVDAWYSAILAPLLADNGTYRVAMLSSLSGKQAASSLQAMREAFATDSQRYQRARISSFDPHTPNLGTPDSADMVLSFGNVHGWRARGNASTMFSAIFDVLRPGGVLGLVDNRAEADSDPDELKGGPYVMQKTVIDLATQAGFKLDAISNINANPTDARSEKTAPADADRMTLRFIKPVKPAHAASR